jgi:hypothetical protein
MRSNISKLPRTFFIRLSIRPSIYLWHSFIAVSAPPAKSSIALATSSVHTICVVSKAIYEQ